MMTPDQIRLSVDALQPAPAHESMDQVAVRVAHWLLTLVEDEHEAIAMTASLYKRAVAGDMPIAAEWEANESALALDLALARALALDLDLDLDLDLALARALFDDALIRILGPRLQPMPDLHLLIADAVDSGSLDMSAWHSCETQHCRAGWANTIHPLGLEVERLFGPEWAGRVIYKVSTGMIPDFFASTSAALADIRRCAGRS